MFKHKSLNTALPFDRIDTGAITLFLNSHSFLFLRINEVSGALNKKEETINVTHRFGNISNSNLRLQLNVNKENGGGLLRSYR